MKILVVTSFNSGNVSPFISEQINELITLGIIADYFLIKGKGIKGYSGNLSLLFQRVDQFKPDIIHAHYGLSGLLANIQREIPVVTTFHGSDINIWYIRPFSTLASLLSVHSIFISYKLAKKAFFKGKYSIIPSGINMGTFFPITKSEARRKLGVQPDGKIILFAGAFNNRIKNYSLARDAVRLLDKAILVELKQLSRREVNLWLNACDVALMTSLHEGSPQFIKEAMACNRPIVSTNVGDVKMVIGNIDGCYIAKPEINDIASKLLKAMEFTCTTDSRQHIIALGLDIKTVALKILNIYNSILRE